MGFENLDYASTASAIYAINGTTQFIRSPLVTDFTQFKKVNIFLKQSQYRPWASISLLPNGSFNTPLYDPYVTRCRFEQSNPLLRLKTLNVVIELDDYAPEDYGITGSALSHDLFLHIFQLGNEENVPAWTRQHFFI